MNEDREIQEAVVKIRAIEQQAPLLQKNIESLSKILIETATALNTLQEISKLEKEKNTKTPIGSGVFIDSKVSKQEKVLMEVGEGAIVEKPIKEVITSLEKRQESIQENIEQMNASLQKMEEEYAQLAKKIQEFRQVH